MTGTPRAERIAPHCPETFGCPLTPVPPLLPKRILWALPLALHAAFLNASPDQPGTAAPVDTPQERPPQIRQQQLDFKTLGAHQVLELRGIDGNAHLPVNIRLDEVVTGARLKLHYTLSPSLLPHLSHLKVYINDEVQAVITVSRERLGTRQTLELPLDPRFFTDYNRLRLQLIGHYTEECEFPFHSSLWAHIGSDSTLELSLQPLELQNDLAILPAPFFDERDNRPLRLPFVFAPGPDLETLRAAGSLASWFGMLAAYRGNHFPVHLDQLPGGHAVVLATPDKMPAGLKLGEITGPGIAIIDHPRTRGAKLLLILGRNGADLKLAADALALGKAALSGSRVQVQKLDYPPRRAAYDAPLWLPVGRPVRFGELVRFPSDLETRGSQLAPLRINARLPPDLFTWQSRGIPIDLRYRYTPLHNSPDAHLSVSINEQFIQALHLPGSGKSGTADRLVLPLLEDEDTQARSDLRIPAFQVGSNNQLQFHFHLPPGDSGKCQTHRITDLQAAIDPDSTLDLSQFHHYAALPNLALFANSGFPFTKYADLAETTVLLPDTPRPGEIQLMLDTLGRLGAHTGTPGLRFGLLPVSRIQEAADRDLLLIASGDLDPAQQQILQTWGQDLPALLRQGERSFAPLTRVQNALYDWFGWQESPPRPEAGRAILSGGGTLASIAGLESPLQAGRSLVILNGTQPEALELIGTALNDSSRLTRIRGDLTFLRGDQVESFRVQEPYYVGKLPWWNWLWFHLHRLPLLLALAGISLGLILTLMAFAALKRITQRRLGQHD